MKHLLTLDMNNYADCTEIFEVTHARALIQVNGAYAMQRSCRGDYKLPGGRLEKGETSIEALKREVLEETVGETNLSENERQKGLELCYANLEEILKTNRSLNLEESRIRDTIFLEMVADR